MRKVFILQIVVVLATLLFCVVSTKFIIYHIPDDYDRLYNINRWLSDTTIKPDIIFFGSSEAMNCIDGDLIKNDYGIESVSYTNTGQSLAEAFLFYSRVPSTTKTVVQIIRAISLCDDGYINDVKANRLVIDGYKLDSFTKTMLKKESIEKMSKSKLEAAFDIRGYLKNGLHSFLRELIEPNQYCDSSNTYIRNAYMFNYERASQDQYDKLLHSLEIEIAPTLKVNDDMVAKLKKAGQYFASRNIRYLLVLSPVSSNAAHIIPSDSKDVIENQRFDFPVFDYTNLLDETEFADPVHPNRKGARVFTNKFMSDFRRL